MPDPLVVTVAPNGARRSKADHPALPVSPDELADTAKSCLQAGAAMLHLHVRDRAGRHVLDAETCREAMRAIRDAVGRELMIQVTTEAVGRHTPEQQMELVRELQPEAVSLALTELIPDASHEEAAGEFLTYLRSESICPQYILYSPADVERFRALCARGVIPQPAGHGVLFVLGRYADQQRAQALDLVGFLAVHDGVTPWTVCAFGPDEHACCVAAAALGGHVRVGFENNLWLRDGRQAPDNAALVGQIREAAVALGRPLARAANLRPGQGEG